MEKLNELVEIFKERDTVRKILQAKDVKAVYEEEKTAMKEQLECFYQEMQPFYETYEWPISDPSEVFSPENVVEVCFILLMSGVNDDDLVYAYDRIEDILDEVQGDLYEIAYKFSEFLYEERKCFSWYTEEEILEKLIL